MIFNFVLISILLIFACVLIYMGLKREPILYLCIGLILSISCYMFSVKSSLSFTTTAYITFFFFSYLGGYILALATVSSKKYNFSHKQLNYSFILTLITCLLSFLVLYLTIQNGGLLNYFGKAMLLRSNVANPNSYAGVENLRPGYLHILSMIFFYFTLFYVINLNFDKLEKNIMYLFFLTVAVTVISVSDISRSRFMDFLLIVLIASYVSGNKKQIKRAIIFVFFGLFVVYTATILQGKASSLLDFMQHVSWYIGAPLYYFDRDFEILREQYLNGSETFHAVYNLLNIIGVIEEYIRIDNRGVSKSGWQAVLVYPGFKHFIIDFGYLGSLTMSFFLGYLSKSLCLFYKYSKMSTAITLSVIYINLNFYSSYRLGDNFYFVALIFIILMVHSKRLKF